MEKKTGNEGPHMDLLFCGNSPLWFEGKLGNMYKITILVHQIRFIFQSTFMSDFFWVLNSWIFCKQMFTWFSVSKRELCKDVLKIIFTWFPFLKLFFIYLMINKITFKDNKKCINKFIFLAKWNNMFI